ncbi:helix-turn-helix domain-containing protein [Vibrio sonorensis]|uniref:helix-turn-helix domain-containing protein n=1 Tax=Vibrio sonorensis TaxID=1004316 RepID=UPI0008DA59F0|nr:AraC family transcriptional regulator [Vibrio sonorensis]
MGCDTDSQWKIDHKLLECSEEEKGKWCVRTLPTLEQQSEFLSAHIGKDISCTVSHCLFEQDYESKITYRHPTTLLVFGVEGVSEFTFVTAGINCIVRPGDVWIFNTCNDELIRKTTAGKVSKMTVVKYATARIEQAFHSIESPYQYGNSSEMTRLGFQQEPDRWISELVRNPMLSASDRLMAEARALELIANWLAPNHLPTCKSASSDLDKVIEILSKNLAHPPSLEALAKEVGMSHTRLNRVFKAEFGMTVFEWLRRQRLERAKHYLSNQAQSVTDIALNCGFSSTSHFTQSFKTHFGQTPSEFRSKG